MVRHTKNLAVFAARLLKCIGPYYDIAKYRVKSCANHRKMSKKRSFKCTESLTRSLWKFGWVNFISQVVDL